MGQDFQVAAFTFHKKDYKRFDVVLRAETSQLVQWCDSQQIWDDTTRPEAMTVGVEMEMWLVNRQTMKPVGACDKLLDELRDSHFTHELGKFQLEYNSPVFTLTGNVLSQMNAVLKQSWDHVSLIADQKCQTRVVAAGTLPSLSPHHLSLDSMAPCHRYKTLNTQLLRMRIGRPVHLQIQQGDGCDEHNAYNNTMTDRSVGPIHRAGLTDSNSRAANIKESTILELDHSNVMMEAACCSFQLHWQIPSSRSARYWNAALIVSLLLVAVGANSPTLFGRKLWYETRIPCFEQADCFGDDTKRGRVGLPRYCRDHMVECFVENLEHQPLLPLLFQSKVEECRHLRLHNGSLWRWLRPGLAFCERGSDTANNQTTIIDRQPHLRMEHRSLPSGPTVVDCIANCALYYGLVEYMAALEDAPELVMPFSVVETNFYCSAQYGLDAQIKWFHLDECHGLQKVDRNQHHSLCLVPVAIHALLLDLIPLARSGLQRLQVDAADIDYYLEIIQHRVETRQTGAVWQVRWLERHPESDMTALTAAYLERQLSGEPVANWSVE